MWLNFCIINLIRIRHMILLMDWKGIFKLITCIYLTNHLRFKRPEWEKWLYLLIRRTINSRVWKIICEVLHMSKRLALWVPDCSFTPALSHWIAVEFESKRCGFEIFPRPSDIASSYFFIISRSNKIFAGSVWHQKWNEIMDFNLNLQST